jgi:hypothetical protein
MKLLVTAPPFNGRPEVRFEATVPGDDAPVALECARVEARHHFGPAATVEAVDKTEGEGEGNGADSSTSPRHLTPPALLALVRHDLADTARRNGLQCVARAIGAADRPADWEEIRADFDTARFLRGSTDDRYELEAARDAAASLKLDDVGAAVGVLAACCGLGVDEWVAATAREREDQLAASKGGA